MASEPSTKKRRLDTQSHNEAETNEDNVKQRLDKFKTDLINEFKPYLQVSEISNDILSYSNHIQIHDLWCNIHKKLGKFSFLMRPGCKLSDIKQFETDKHVSIPSDLRLSLMICDAVMFPPIFTKDGSTNVHTEAPQPLNFAPEICLAPLTEWFVFLQDEVTFSSYYEDYMDKAAWEHDKTEWDDFQIFCDWDDGYSLDKCKDIMQIGSCPSVEEAAGIHMFWNMKNGKIYSFHVSGYRAEYDGYGTLYDSFEDYLRRWNIAELNDYYNSFTRNWLELDDESMQRDAMNDYEADNINVEVVGGMIRECCREDFGSSRMDHMNEHCEEIAEIIKNRCF